MKSVSSQKSASTTVSESRNRQKLCKKIGVYRVRFSEATVSHKAEGPQNIDVN